MLVVEGRIKNVVCLSDRPLKSETLADARTCTRVSLFEWAHKPSEDEVAKAKAEALVWLTANKPSVILSFSSIDTDESVTHHWPIFQAVDGHRAMLYAFYDWHGSYICPVLGFSPHTKELQKWANHQAIRRALRIANGTECLLERGASLWKCRDNALTKAIGEHHYGNLIAVDIESIEGTGAITAVGLCYSPHCGISIPFDAYKPYGHEELEPGGSEEQLDALKRVLASDIPKVFHNHTFDVPRLESRGYAIGGVVHDTFCAMAIAYPELPHGLQTSCATLLAVPPWKSLWHPKLPGITKEDIEYWICDPVALRKYNAEDAFYTWHLARVLLPQVGIRI